MIRTGILNPNINGLLSRIRHTNKLVIADRGFPYWPNFETVDISLVDDIPTIVQVLRAILPNFCIGPVWMAEEFRLHNPVSVLKEFAAALGDAQVTYERHLDFKNRVPGAIGLIRTADTTPYANIILESA